MNAHRSGHVQQLLQLLHHHHGPILGLNQGKAAELAAGAADQATLNVAWVDLRRKIDGGDEVVVVTLSSKA
jgi:hypothetical protein